MTTDTDTREAVVVLDAAQIAAAAAAQLAREGLHCLGVRLRARKRRGGPDLFEALCRVSAAPDPEAVAGQDL